MTDPMVAFTQIRELIYQVCGIPVADISLADSLIMTLGMDSVELIDLFMRLEALGIAIPEQQITAALTVGDITALLRHAE